MMHPKLGVFEASTNQLDVTYTLATEPQCDTGIGIGTERQLSGPVTICRYVLRVYRSKLGRESSRFWGIITCTPGFGSPSFI